MDDKEFLDRAENLLNAVERECDRLNDETDVDIDNQRVGYMLTLLLANNVELVINLQKPLQEVWLAAPRGGFHYHYEEGQWKEHKHETEFFSTLSSCISEATGQKIRIQSCE